MKGISKFVSRTPHMLSGKVGMATKSHDAQFDDLNRRYTVIEKYVEKLAKDSTTFRDGVKSLLLAGSEFSEHFNQLFRPMGNELDLERKHPQASNTIVNLNYFQGSIDELRETLTPEIELIETRILTPINEMLQILKSTRKNIVKRDHKLIDYDRANNAFAKIRDKKEKTLKDEQNLFKLEQDYETAAADYEYYNNNMKEELPRFFEMAVRFITPLFYSFYYMQLNVYYLTLEKMQTFADGRYDISAEASANIENDYVNSLNDAVEKLDALSIRKPTMPSARILQQSRTSGSNPTSPIGSKMSGPGLGRSTSTTKSVPPPSYSATGGGAAAVAASSGAGIKRPPPPPPAKPKPGATSAIQYVVALYDYTAQADGDLSFNAGERIEVVEKTGSTDDWWTGKINGHQGVFPGNYVREE